MLNNIPDIKIFKFEKIDLEMLEISKKIFGYEDEYMCVDKINASPKKTGSSKLLDKYYSKSLYDMVYYSYKKDFDYFGYDR